jgi:pyridoxine/pyridoxamine 5'-phosphate oxidase
LQDAHSYWLATTRLDGRPQVIPVWGIWFDGKLLFGTSTGSRKARNLARNPAIAIHLESGDDVVILEGSADELSDAALFARYADAYDAKYTIRPSDGAESDGITYVVRPLRVLAWLERDFLKTPTRWTFARDSPLSD